ncbi:MAG: acyltransferase domain-containing protein, partial [Polyangiaceae bacterium]
PARFAGEIGVWAGSYNDSYYTENVLRRPDVVEKVGAFQAMVGNEKDFVATRIAHRLDLGGPAISVHTACSTALVALTEAYWALRTGQCDLALAGGAAVTCPQKSGYLHAEGGMLSADGHTRTFDAQASGTVFSDGAAMVVLRRLDDALAAGDRIWAIVRGAATNNDGGAKMSFSAPSVDGQAKVIAKAQAVAGVEPESIGYIEAHGTATPLGDPIEVEGLTQAFARKTSRTQFCGIGSIKSNFGHLTAPAGAAGIIKTAFALDRELLPATVHFRTPNPKIDFGRTPFFVVDKATPWPRSGTPRRAGVSSFGVGGTNAHVVLEEAPLPAERPASTRPWQLFPVSARSAAALEAATRRLADGLERGTADLDDVAFTLQSGRRAFAERRFVVAADAAGAAAALRKAATAGTSGRARERKPPVVFVFPGQGSQYPGMGRGLAAHEPRFAATVARCCEILRPHLDRDLREVIWPEAGDAEAAAELLKQTHFTQPALFAIEYALADLWTSRGLVPDTMLGHSVGEFVAACLAGVFSLEDALGLVALRGKMMQGQPRGSMLSVRLPAREVEPRLRAPLGIAAINAPNLCVVAGPDEAIDAFAKELEAAGTACSRLHTSHAFHSSMMDPIVAPFEERVRAVRLSRPQRPFVSTVTALPITDAEATDPGYWARHLRATVRFADAVAEVWKVPDRVLLEVGPRTTAATLARQVAADPKKQLAISSLEASPEAAAENGALLRATGQLWVAGVAVDLAALHDGERRPRRVPLPTYPFEHKRYWIDPPRAGAAVPAPAPPPPWAGLPAAPMAAASSAASRTSGSFAATPPNRTVSEEATMTAAPGPDRRGRLIARIRTVFEEASGIDLADAEPDASFIELGLDSLSLTQCAQLLQKSVGAKVTFRQLIEDLPTLGSLAEHLDAVLPPEALPAPTPTPTPTPVPVPVPGPRQHLLSRQPLYPRRPTPPCPPSIRPRGAVTPSSRSSRSSCSSWRASSSASAARPPRTPRRRARYRPHRRWCPPPSPLRHLPPWRPVRRRTAPW